MGLCGKEILYALVIMLGPITFGTIMVYPSPTAVAIQKEHGLTSSSLEWSFYNSVSSLFAIGGPFVTTGILKMVKGSRRKTVFIIAVVGTIFWYLNCLTKVHIWAGIVIRAVLGLVMGAYSSIGPMYLVEVAKEGYSGFFGSLNQIGIVLGMVFYDFIAPSLNYMALNYIGGAITALQAILVWFIPETGNKKDYTSNSEQEAKGAEKNKESLCQKKYIGGIAIGVVMMVVQQFCGINAILTNLAELMNASGLAIDGNYQAGIASSAQLIAVFIGGLLVDKLGRKVCWMLSNIIAAVFLLIFALNTKYNWSNVLPLVCIFLYQLGFGLGLGPIPWFLIPEYFSDAVRPIATTIVSASNWIFAFCIIFLWPVMRDGMGMFGSLIFFLCFPVFGVFFGFFFVHEPENKGEAEVPEESSSSDKPEAL